MATKADKQHKITMDAARELGRITAQAIRDCWYFDRFVDERCRVVKAANARLCPKYKDAVFYAGQAAYATWDASQEWIRMTEDGKVWRVNDEKPTGHYDQPWVGSHVYRGTLFSPTEAVTG